jgi:hypothetical protein
MSTREQLIKARLGVLALAQELENIRLACKRAGISKSQFYEIKSAYEKYGPEGLAHRCGANPGCRIRRRRRSKIASSR